MRKKVIIANWKMNKTRDEALDFIYMVNDKMPDQNKVSTVVCAQAILLRCLVKRQGDNLRIGAENMFYKDEGAYTGEISPVVLKNTGVEYVILGHSERRNLFMESDEMINLKVKAAINHGLKPILCVGETLEQIDDADKVIDDQLRKCLDGVSDISSIIIGYEPVWAIGTGKSADAKIAEDRISKIRKILNDMYGAVSNEVSIVYGGSVSPNNIRSFLNEPNIDGALIGNSALDPNKYVEMVLAAIE